jgi:hypothetical protein
MQEPAKLQVTAPSTRSSWATHDLISVDLSAFCCSIGCRVQETESIHCERHTLLACQSAAARTLVTEERRLSTH